MALRKGVFFLVFLFPHLNCVPQRQQLSFTLAIYSHVYVYDSYFTKFYFFIFLNFQF